MATETHEAATSVCLNDHGGAVGMPQLCGEWMGNQVFWLVVTLVVIFFVLSKIALPRIASVLAERAGTITNDLAAAEDLKQKAVEAEEAYNKALADARVEAARIVAEAKADTEIAAKAAESTKAIDEIRAGALDAVKDVAKDTAEEIVAAMGGKVDAKSITSAVTARMKG